MQTRTIRTGHALTQIGFGGAQLGNLYERRTDAQAQDALEAAWSHGIRYFDTAPHYGLGLSEQRLGKFLAEQPRDDYVLSTKVGRLLEPSPGTAHRLDDEGFVVPAASRRVFDFSRDGVLRSLDASMQRLRTDRIDIAFLHDPDDYWDAASTTGIDALLELRQEGVLGAVGVGMNRTALLTRFIQETDIDVVMVAGRLTLLDQSAHTDLLPAAAENNVAVIAAGVFNSGILSTDTVPDNAFYDYEHAPAQVLDHARKIAGICARWHIPLPAAALHYPALFGQVAATVVGLGTAQHVREAVERESIGISPAFWEELAAEGLASAPR